MDGDDQLCKVMKEKHLESVYNSAKGRGDHAFGADSMFLSSVKKAVAAIRIIQETKGEVLLTARFQGGDLVASRRGEVVLRAMGEGGLEYEWARAHYKLSPYIEKFYEVRSSFPYQIISHTGFYGPETLTQINEYVMAVYKAITSAEFKKAERAQARAANKLYVSFMGYIDDIVAKYARLVVVRIDLSYKRPEPDDGFDSVGDEVVKEASLVQVCMHRELLLKKLSKTSSPYAMVGYAWKLEYGKRKGLHYHLMLFLDGSKVMRHVAIGKSIGEMWVNEITEGAGSYWNCTGKEFYYKTCGVGEVDYYDAPKIQAVKDAAAYLVKIDRWITTLVPKGMRCFGKGVVKKVEGTTLGRPRTKGHQAQSLV
jgi:hypothetical protein